MKVIQLTKGFKTLLDNDDFKIFNKFKWCSNSKGNRIYAFRTQRYGLRREGKYFSIYLHREILKVKQNEYVDHINGNTLDNRKRNLRICTNQQNSFNHDGQPKQRKNTHFKGVKKNSNCSTWSARITLNNKSIYLGCFKTEIEAAKAYNEAAIKYFKEFARINIL